MILGGKTIRDEYHNGKIVIDPYDDDCIGPNSYDVHLDSKVICHYTQDNYEEFDICDGLELSPNCLYLASTVESIGSNDYVPMLEGRSSIGRMGLFVHVTAGFGDLGFKYQWTLELVATIPVRIFLGMRIAQVFFHTATDTSIQYTGSYVGQKGPTRSKFVR